MLWLVPGVLMWLSYILCGLALCVTLVGIPFGVQAFKLAGLTLAPFGKKIVKANTALAR